MRPYRLIRLTLAFLLASCAFTFAQSNDRVMPEALNPSTPLQENLRVLAGCPTHSRFLANVWEINKLLNSGT